MESVFVDTDIIIDLLAARKPFYEYAAGVFSLADKGRLRICVSSLSFSNVNYLLTRQYNADQSRKKLLKFKTLVTVFEVNDKIIELALASDFKDFEDGIQYFTAIENGSRMLLTRNLKDYKAAGIPVMTAESYMKQFV